MATYNTNDLFANRYVLLEKIGVGGFSEVWKAQDQMAEDAVVAIKIYAPERGMDELGLKQFRREYAVVLNLNHPNLLTARHFDVYNDSPYLVMPYIDGGSLYSKHDETGNFTEAELADLIEQMADALDFLHENEVLHQDIKPDNVLINNRGRYLLTDFGISSRLRSSLRKSTTTNKAMTVAYAPPERFVGKQEAQPAGDIFSLGVLLYELAIGDVPWMGAGGVVVKPDSEPIELSDDYSNRFQQLVQACLRFHPDDRPTAKELKNWAAQFKRDGSWPAIPQPQPKAPGTRSGGRKTQRMEDIPSVQNQEENNAPAYSGKEAATMRPGEMPVNNPNRPKKKTGLIVAAASVILLGGAAAFYFANAGPSEDEILAQKEAEKKVQFSKLLFSADSLKGLNDLTGAKGLYEQAIALFPSDSGALAALAELNRMAEMVTPVDTTAGDTTVVEEKKVEPTTPTTTPTKTPTIPTKPPIEEKKKPTEDELRRQRLKELENVNNSGEYDLTNQYSNGARYNYKGAVRNGKPHGIGTAYFSNGDKYEGSWENGVRTGAGTFTFKDGTVYNGSWRNDKFNGQGNMIWTDGDNYRGSYQNGMRNGYGTYTSSGGDIKNCPDCKKYVGYWKDNEKVGSGKCYGARGQLLYDGEFVGGSPSGRYPNR